MLQAQGCLSVSPVSPRKLTRAHLPGYLGRGVAPVQLLVPLPSRSTSTHSSPPHPRDHWKPRITLLAVGKRLCWAWDTRPAGSWNWQLASLFTHDLLSLKCSAPRTHSLLRGQQEAPHPDLALVQLQWTPSCSPPRVPLWSAAPRGSLPSNMGSQRLRMPSEQVVGQDGAADCSSLLPCRSPPTRSTWRVSRAQGTSCGLWRGWPRPGGE